MFLRIKKTKSKKEKTVIKYIHPRIYEFDLCDTENQVFLSYNPNIKLFDVYKGSQIPEGKKSVAYSVSYRAADRTLVDDEINAVFTKTVKRLESELKAQLR